MATQINKEEAVVLQDGREVIVRPLNIKGLRKFMAVVKKFGEVSENEDNVEDNDAGLDLMVEAVQIALAKADPEIAEDVDYLEENLDMHCIERIMAVAGGVDISGDVDPNPRKG